MGEGWGNAVWWLGGLGFGGDGVSSEVAKFVKCVVRLVSLVWSLCRSSHRSRKKVVSSKLLSLCSWCSYSSCASLTDAAPSLNTVSALPPPPPPPRLILHSPLPPPSSPPNRPPFYRASLAPFCRAPYNSIYGFRPATRPRWVTWRLQGRLQGRLSRRLSRRKQRWQGRSCIPSPLCLAAPQSWLPRWL